MRLHRISLPGFGVSLSGLVYEPNRPKRRLMAILTHGFTASKESLDLLAAYLCSRGYLSVTYDMRGHKLGGSEGSLYRLEEAVADLLSATVWMQEQSGIVHTALIGHSMGGLLSMAAARQLDSTAGVAAIAISDNPSSGFDSPAGAAMLKQRSDYVEGASAMELIRQSDRLAEEAPRLLCPLLLVAARGDVLVRTARMRAWAYALGEKASYIEVEGSHQNAPERAKASVADWLELREKEMHFFF
jgi:pimeloyl-ACP methyl ester carboxylesterase